MPNPKQPYAQAFRDQMVELVHSGRKPSELSKEFGCHATSILSWVRQAASSGVTALPVNAAPLSTQEREELVELRRKYRQLQQERDILAKATAWFANNGAPTSTTSTR
jgi:transposase